MAFDGAKLFRLMDAAGITTTEFIEQSGISRQETYDLVKQRYRPRFHTAERIAEFFGMEIDGLRSREVEKGVEKEIPRQDRGAVPNAGVSQQLSLPSRLHPEGPPLRRGREACGRARNENGELEKMRTKIARFALCSALFAVVGLLPSAVMALDQKLTWTDTSSNEDGFIVETEIAGAWKELGRTAANVATFTDPSGQPGKCYRVVAFNAVGSSKPSNTACTTIKLAVSLTLLGNPATEDWTVEAKSNVSGDIRIEFEVNAKVFRIENAAPYALHAQTAAGLTKKRLGAGQYVIIARVYEQTGAVALATSPTLIVTEGTSPEAPTTLIVVQ